MHVRRFGKTNRSVSEIGFGAWAIGGSWGTVDDAESLAAMHASVDAGVTFFDTADVYGDGRSERLIGQLLRERPEELFVATKFGRRAALDPREYTYENLRSWLERSRENLGVEVIDLVQLHCPPWQTYYMPEVFESCERLVEDRLVTAYGCSVEKVEEGLKAIEYPSVASVQIVFNLARQRPAELFLGEAARRDVAVIARVPLASGLLTGKFDERTTFDADDHRSFNRHGEQFDVGETLAGLDFRSGLTFVDALRPLVPDGMTMTQFALRWILDHDAVSTVIPGARTPDQAQANAAASDCAPLPDDVVRAVAALYSSQIAPITHQRW